MKPEMTEQLVNRKWLAAMLGRAPGYVSAMKRAGFRENVPGLYRYSDAMAWLQANPGFRTSQVYACNRWRRKSAPTVAEQLEGLTRAVHQALKT